MSSLPAAMNQDAKAIAYTVKAEDNKGALHITRTLRCDLLWLAKDKYGVLRHFFQLVRTGDDEQVVLQPIS